MLLVWNGTWAEQALTSRVLPEESGKDLWGDRVASVTPPGRAHLARPSAAGIKEIFINLPGRRCSPLGQSAHLEKISLCCSVWDPSARSCVAC